MQAIILAGGQGTRLRSVVPDIPKPLASIAGRPFLSWFLDRLDAHGFDVVVLSVGYMSSIIQETMGTRHGGIALRYAVEAVPMGTGGGLRDALDKADGFPVFAFNGDTYIEIDYAAMLQTHRMKKAKLTVAVRHIEDASRYGRAIVEGGHIVGFAPGGEPGAGFINVGAYIFSANLLASTGLPQAFSFEKDFLDPNIAALRPAAYAASGYFIDIGVPEDYARAQTEIPARVGNL